MRKLKFESRSMLKAVERNAQSLVCRIDKNATLLRDRQWREAGHRIGRNTWDIGKVLLLKGSGRFRVISLFIHA